MKSLKFQHVITILVNNMSRGFLILFISITIIAALIKGQNFCWDCLHYHYYNGWAFWHNRINYDITPTDELHSYFFPLVDALEYLGFYYLPPPLFISLMGAISGVGIYFVFLVNKLILKNYNIIIILTATFIATTGIAHIMQVGSITNENIVAVFLIAGLYYQLIYYQSERYRHLIGSGILLGLALSVKLTAITGVFGVFCSFFLLNFKIINNSRKYLILLLSFLITFFLIDGFWLIKMYHMFHNPIYPNFNNIFSSKDSFIFNRDMIYTPKSWVMFMLLPFQLMFKTANLTDFSAIRDWHFSLAIVAIISYLILQYRNLHHLTNLKIDNVAKKQWYAILITFIASYLAWEFLFTIQRYTIFVEYLSGVIIINIILLATKNYSNLLRNLLLAIAVILASFTIKSANIGYAPLSANIKNLFNFKVTGALVLLDSGTAYLAPMLGVDNLYINLPDYSLQSLQHGAIKNKLLTSYLNQKKPVYLIYDNANINNIVFTELI